MAGYATGNNMAVEISRVEVTKQVVAMATYNLASWYVDMLIGLVILASYTYLWIQYGYSGREPVFWKTHIVILSLKQKVVK